MCSQLSNLILGKNMWTNVCSFKSVQTDYNGKQPTVDSILLNWAADLYNFLENFAIITSAILDLSNELVEISYEILNELLDLCWDILHG